MIEILNTYDWREAFAYAGEPSCNGSPNVHWVEFGDPVSASPFTREDVAEVIAMDEGENDGPEWLCVGRLTDGRHFLVAAGCDYTGWDCQADGSATVAATLEDLIRFGMGDEERRRLGLACEPRDGG